MDRAVLGRVFISYVREDSAAADRLQAALEAAGFQVWRDRAELWPGADWQATIREAIADQAVVFLACFSRVGLARAKSYQREELNQAIEQLRLRHREVPWLIPVRFDDCQVPDWSIGAGRTLRSLQHVDFFGPDQAEAMSRLVAAVSKALDPARVPAGPGRLRRSRRKIVGLPSRLVVLVLAGVLAAGVITSVVEAVRDSHGGGPGLLSVQGRPWTVTGSNLVRRTLTAGHSVRYAFEIDNPTGSTVSAGIRFEAYWGVRDQQPVNIYGVLFTTTIQPGRSTVYSPHTTVPASALPGMYTEQADISARNDPADHTGQYGTFNVAGRKLLGVPFLASSSVRRPDGVADGAACVAMLLGSHPGASHPAVGAVRDYLAAAQPARGPAGGAAVAGERLEYALAHFGIAEVAIAQISYRTAGVPEAQITAMAIAIRQGSPIIAFVDGADLPSGGSGPSSTGRWVVVVGLRFAGRAGTEILLNDPAAGAGQSTPGQPVSIGAFARAVTDAANLPAAQQEPGRIAGIVVAP